MRIVARTPFNRSLGHRTHAERLRILRLQREVEVAQQAGDIGRAWEIAQAKLEAVRRLHGVAS